MSELSQNKEAPTLSINDLSIAFGGLKAVSKFSMTLKPRDLHGLIGPNGAGKTTVFNLLTGVYPADSGTMTLGSKNLFHKKPYEITQSGIARTFQNIRLFADLPVIDNVLLSYHAKRPYSLVSSLLRTPGFYRKEGALREEATQLLTLMNLGHRIHHRAGSLSYGDQRRLEIARALATSPQVLLLDEPAAGLNSREKVDLMNTVSKIRDQFNVTILLIEHDMKLVMGICERIIVLDHGVTIAEGTPEQIQKNPKVIEAYLGVA